MLRFLEKTIRLDRYRYRLEKTVYFKFGLLLPGNFSFKNSHVVLDWPVQKCILLYVKFTHRLYVHWSNVRAHCLTVDTDDLFERVSSIVDVAAVAL